MTGCDVETDCPGDREHEVHDPESAGRKYDDRRFVSRECQSRNEQRGCGKARTGDGSSAEFQSVPCDQSVAHIAAGEIPDDAEQKGQRRINSHFGFAETAAPYQKNGEPRHEEPGTPRVAAIHAKDQPDLSMAQETPPRVGETGGA